MNNALWLLLVVALCPRTAEGGTCHVSDSAATFVADDSIVPRHTIFVGGDLRNPRIVLFHELPGLSPHDLALGARLACEGFRVYMPLMFGQKGDKNWGQKQVCNPIDGVRLFWCNDGGREHPILSQWVRDAVARIGKDGAPLAVIGMCLTGTFALSLADAANVVVAVMAQPTLPVPVLWKTSALDLPDALLSSALERLANRDAGLFLVRARFDVISSSEKCDHLQWSLRHARRSGLRDVYVRQTFSAHHSVLTQAVHQDNDVVMTELLAMLRRHLQQRDPNGGLDPQGAQPSPTSRDSLRPNGR